MKTKSLSLEEQLSDLPPFTQMAVEAITKLKWAVEMAANFQNGAVVSEMKNLCDETFKQAGEIVGDIDSNESTTIQTDDTRQIRVWSAAVSLGKSIEFFLNNRDREAIEGLRDTCIDMFDQALMALGDGRHVH